MPRAVSRSIAAFTPNHRKAGSHGRLPEAAAPGSRHAGRTSASSTARLPPTKTEPPPRAQATPQPSRASGPAPPPPVQGPVQLPRGATCRPSRLIVTLSRPRRPQSGGTGRAQARSLSSFPKYSRRRRRTGRHGHGRPPLSTTRPGPRRAIPRATDPHRRIRPVQRHRTPRLQLGKRHDDTVARGSHRLF